MGWNELIRAHEWSKLCKGQMTVEVAGAPPIYLQISPLSYLKLTSYYPMALSYDQNPSVHTQGKSEVLKNYINPRKQQSMTKWKWGTNAFILFMLEMIMLKHVFCAVS